MCAYGQWTVLRSGVMYLSVSDTFTYMYIDYSIVASSNGHTVSDIMSAFTVKYIHCVEV